MLLKVACYLTIAAWILPFAHSQAGTVYIDITEEGNDVKVKTSGSFSNVDALSTSSSSSGNSIFLLGPSSNQVVLLDGNYWYTSFSDDATCNNFFVNSNVVNTSTNGAATKTIGFDNTFVYHPDIPTTDPFDDTVTITGKTLANLNLSDGGTCSKTFTSGGEKQTIIARVGSAVPSSTNIQGDPHFKTWTGHKFDYHGECDLVFADNPDFADGLGLKIHVRTKIKSIMSYIERVAIQIGQDIFELTNTKNEWTRNGQILIQQDQPDAVYQKYSDLGGFKVRLYRKALSIRLDESIKARIDFKTRKDNMPSLRLFGQGSGIFDGTLGMVGHWKTGKMVGRDGTTLMEDPSEFAREWQVRPLEDGSLFSDLRDPIYPAQCKMPKGKFVSRLGDSHLRAAAEKECAAWKEDKDECVMDVMVTRSIETAREVPSVGVGGDKEEEEEDDWHGSNENLANY